jgi:hypothetical protein
MDWSQVESEIGWLRLEIAKAVDTEDADTPASVLRSMREGRLAQLEKLIAEGS